MFQVSSRYAETYDTAKRLGSWSRIGEPMVLSFD